MTIPDPDITDIAAFGAALAEGRLLVRHCTACDRHHHYPRSYCPFCGSGATDWTESNGTATIYSLTRWRKRDGAIVPAFVTLPEGPTIMAMIVGDDDERLRIGDRVRLAPTPATPALAAFTAA